MRFHRICAREINNDCRGTIRRPTFIGGIPRTGHVSAHMLDVLHWSPFQDQVVFRISALAWRYLLGLLGLYFSPARSLLSHFWVHEVAVPSDQWNGGGWYSLSLLPVLQLTRLVLSLWLAALFGMGLYLLCDCSLESGALLSSNLGEALYKST